MPVEPFQVAARELSNPPRLVAVFARLASQAAVKTTGVQPLFSSENSFVVDRAD
jgi:hypothetical protein